MILNYDGRQSWGHCKEFFASEFPHNSSGQFYECVNSNGSCQRRKDNDTSAILALSSASAAASCTKVIKFDIKSCNKIITGPCFALATKIKLVWQRQRRWAKTCRRPRIWPSLSPRAQCQYHSQAQTQSRSRSLSLSLCQAQAIKMATCAAGEAKRQVKRAKPKATAAAAAAHPPQAMEL